MSSFHVAGHLPVVWLALLLLGPVAQGQRGARAALSPDRGNAGPGQGPMDFRFDISLEDMTACNVAPENDNLGIPGAQIMTPGNPAASVMSLRMNTTGADRMPPLGTNIVDPDGTAAVDAWIGGLTSCSTAPPPVNQAPAADAGPDQTVDPGVGAVVVVCPD